MTDGYSSSLATVLYDQDTIAYEDLRKGVDWAQQQGLDLLRVRFHSSANPSWSGRLFQDCDIPGGGSAGFEETMADTLRSAMYDGPVVIVWAGESEMIREVFEVTPYHPHPIFEYRVDDHDHSIRGNMPTVADEGQEVDLPFDEGLAECLKEIRGATFAGDDQQALVEKIRGKLDEDPTLLAKAIESLLLESDKPEIFELVETMNTLDRQREYRVTPLFMSPDSSEFKRGVQYRRVPDGLLPTPPGGWKKAEVTFPSFLLREVKIGILARVLLAAGYDGPDEMVGSFVELVRSEEPDLGAWCNRWLEQADSEPE